jgi:transitional endoplasmic reticulum ATPase
MKADGEQPNVSNRRNRTFIVHEAPVGDVGKGLARIPQEDMTDLGIGATEVVEIIGTHRTVARILPVNEEPADPGLIQMDGITRENAGVGVDDFVEVRKTASHPAETVLLSPVDVTRPLPQPDEAGQLAMLLAGLPVFAGNKLEVAIFGYGRQYFLIEGTAPHGAVFVTASTTFRVKPPDATGERVSRVSYEDIGGLGAELQRVREIIEYPMRYPKLFQKLGLEAPKGVLLVGPSGTGKTLIARAVASEVKAHFIHLNGPEVMQKFYGESEARLRQVFAEANANAPSIIFLDEIDAIAPKRTESIGNVEKRVVAQLLVLMDGLVSRGKVVVIGATNVPNLLDPALRRPGRFDREILINPPNTPARLEILKIHSRRLSLHRDVDLEKMAERTHGFVGADLEALVKEAGMEALRRILSEMRKRGEDPNRIDQLEVNVRGEDFLTALKDIEPSALREFLPEKSALRLSDVGGLRQIKKNIRPLIEMALHAAALEPDSLGMLPGGFFFTGAAGTGKTYLARALAGEYGLPLINVYSSTLFSRWVGESEKALEEIFRKARQVAPCILLLDEVDSIAPIRRSTEDSGVTQRMVNQLLREIDKTRDFRDLIVIATTNRMDLVDPALVRAGRFDFIVQFDPPDRQDRLEILAIHTREMGLPEGDLVPVAEASEGLCGSDLESICRRARMQALQREFNAAGGGEAGPRTHRAAVRPDDLLKALEELREGHGGPSAGPSQGGHRDPGSRQGRREGHGGPSAAGDRDVERRREDSARSPGRRKVQRRKKT